MFAAETLVAHVQRIGNDKKVFALRRLITMGHALEKNHLLKLVCKLVFIIWVVFGLQTYIGGDVDRRAWATACRAEARTSFALPIDFCSCVFLRFVLVALSPRFKRCTPALYNSICADEQICLLEFQCVWHHCRTNGLIWIV